MNKSKYNYQSDACSTIVGTCSLSMRLLKGSGSGQSKKRVDGKDWLITGGQIKRYELPKLN